MSEIRNALDIAKESWLGASYEPDCHNGCCWAATIIASYYSPWAANEYNLGVVYVPTLVNHAKNDNLYITFSENNLEPGDIIVYGDEDHVVVFEGDNETSYIGNSSSRGYIVNGSDYHYMGGVYPTGIIKTSYCK